MSDDTPSGSDNLPEWWQRLTPDEQASLRRIMGDNWQPSEDIEKVGREFDIVRERIRQIEQRALKKLRGDDDGKDPAS